MFQEKKIDVFILLKSCFAQLNHVLALDYDQNFMANGLNCLVQIASKFRQAIVNYPS